MNEQKQVARDLVACYSDNVRQDYHSRIQIYESLDKRRNKEDTSALANVRTHIEFEIHSPPK